MVPKFVLERFARDGQIALETNGVKRVVSTSKAATRKNFYRRTRPDRSRIDDVEHTLSQLENRVAPTLKMVERGWPVSNEEKAILAQHFGMQVVRVPKWKDWFNTFISGRLGEIDGDPFVRLDSGIVVPISSADREEVANHLTTDTNRLHRMLKLGVRIASILGSMHWRLLAFEEPMIGISDHPVVQIPISWPVATDGDPFDHGAANCLEVYAPVSPWSVILMTWINEPDPDIPWRATREQAGMINSKVKAQAEHQWMHHPDHEPAQTSDAWVPITSQIVPSYDPEVARASPRRAMVSDILERNDWRESDEIELVFASWKDAA